MASGEWGRFVDVDDEPISDTGWTFGLDSVPISGECREQVHPVFAEFDCSNGGTSDGQHFLGIEAFESAEDARRFADRCRSSGEWGRFDPCEGWSSTGWYIGVETLSLR